MKLLFVTCIGFMAFTISLAQLPNYPEGPTDQGEKYFNYIEFEFFKSNYKSEFRGLENHFK